MTPSYFVEDLKGDQVQSHYRVHFDLNDSQASYSPSSSSFSAGRMSLCSDQEEDKVKPCGEFCDHPPVMDGTTDKSTFWKDQLEEGSEDHDNSLYQWMPSKMRILRKMMMSSNQRGGNFSADSGPKCKDQEESPSAVDQPTNRSRKTCYKNTIDDTIRVCSDCNTTKTPLWRSGPRGPKSLCNACGIRQRKARRAVAAAAAAANGTILPLSTTPLKIKVKHKNKRSKSDLSDAPLKKRCKMAPNSPPNGTEKKTLIRFEDFTSRVLSKHYSAYEKVFPQDEKEAAILLMALSCGLVCS